MWGYLDHLSVVGGHLGPVPHSYGNSFQPLELREVSRRMLPVNVSNCGGGLAQEHSLRENGFDGNVL